jgi:hypothetical protein
MSAAGGFPAADVTGRMAMFGRLFGEEVGVSEPATLASASDLVKLVKDRVPRDASPADDAPVLEAAAFVGEWLRTRAEAIWVAEGPHEPMLQVVDASRAIVHLIPIVHLLRTASTAGYDGLSHLIERITADVAMPATPTPIESLRVMPESERAAVVAWIQRYRGLVASTRAALWRRCQACSTPQEDGITMHHAADDWEAEAAMAAAILARRPFACVCGGPAGDTTRFLMLRADETGERLCEIRASNAASRVACWRLVGETALPFDATTFRAEPPTS